MVHCRKHVRRGYRCTRFPGHDGDCHIVGTWWNLIDWIRYCRKEFWR